MNELSATELAEKIKNRELSVSEASMEALDLAEKDTHNCFITICERERVLERAKEVQGKIDRGELTESPLAGVPIAVKDNICTKDVRTTCGSRMLEDFIPAYSASVVERLEQAGLILIGKTNMDEFGMGSTSETSFFGPVINPNMPNWKNKQGPREQEKATEQYVAGGSSGGSAAAVAAGIVPLALGTDTGGSIRQPSSHCGVAGLKPTYGTVSRFGLVAYASSMDQIGPIARTSEDAKALWRVIAGPDEKDSTCIRAPRPDAGSRKQLSDMKGIRIGIPRAVFSRGSSSDAASNAVSGTGKDVGVDARVLECVTGMAREWERQGAVIEEFDLKMIDYSVPAYYIIACAEASSNLARFDGVKYGYRAEAYEDLSALYENSREEGFGEEVRRRIRLGEYVLSQGYYDAYYLKACQVRRLIYENYKKAFENYDFILTPTAPTTAPRVGESLTDPIRMYQSDLYTVPANLVGLPAIAFPCGKVDGMPVGAQLTGDLFSEERLFEIVSLEKARVSR